MTKYRAQLEAAHDLLTESTTSLQKLEKIQTLVYGINPRLDKKLSAAFSAYRSLKKVGEGDIVHLTVHSLPVATSADRRRKKALLLFLSTWKSLQAEVARLSGYVEGIKSDPSARSVASKAVKTAAFSKGPLGIITLLAASVLGVSLLAKNSLVTVTVENNNCPPFSLTPNSIGSLSGISLTRAPITPSSLGVLRLPPVSFSLTSDSSSLSFSLFAKKLSFSLPQEVTGVTFDGTQLLGRTTALDLKPSSTHTLSVTCR